MEQEDKISGYGGVIPMVRIDGGKIRQLREKNGLTQLYLSTVVGVTTDTISRWENRHYQSVKLENAEKLATALDVQLQDILEEKKEENALPPLVAETIEQHGISRPGSRKILFLLSLIVLALAAGIILFAVLPERRPAAALSAKRILPPHVPPGQTFPVLISVNSAQQKPVSLIISETLPPGSEFLQGLPEVTTLDRQDRSLKWLSRTGPQVSIYAYVCKIGPDTAQGELLPFSGTVTLKQTAGDHENIGGSSALTIAPFHWADTNRDLMIDDEEILVVYDLYSDIAELDFDRDLIDSIWAARGYAWDSERQQYEVLE